MSNVTYDDVKGCVLAVVKMHGRDAAISLLRLFGVERAYRLQQEEYADFVECAGIALRPTSTELERAVAHLAAIGERQAAEALHPLDAAMIARDGAPKAKPAPAPAPAPVSLAKPAPSGLLRVSSMSHQLGMGR